MTELKEILCLVEQYYSENKKILPYNKVPISGKVYDSEELKNLVESSLEGWWTEGKWTKLFEDKLKNFLEVKHILTVNSGSSANLLAMSVLTSPKLKERKIMSGDEIITVASGFPTTINPIIQIGAVPVFVDVDIGTYNAIVEEIEKAITEKTKAIFLAHTLGNPFNVRRIKELCEKHNIWLIEDNCDALGSQYEDIFTGRFGDLATLSFYPAHHLTTAEGGAILTDNPVLYQIARSMRDWGRDCWCNTGQDNNCGNRFSKKLGDLPFGYDHKYTYSEIGYNLKMTDLQASIGVAQMDKLGEFMIKRRENFQYLLAKLKQMDHFQDYFVLPQTENYSNPSWFGFLLTIKSEKINRQDLLKYLNNKGIATRLLFGGNITKQPYFISQKINYRIVGDLKNTDIIMKNTFWIGIYPALKKEHLNYMCEMFQNYLKEINQ